MKLVAINVIQLDHEIIYQPSQLSQASGGKT